MPQQFLNLLRLQDNRMGTVTIGTNEFRRMAAAEQMLDNLRSYIGNLMLEEEHPLVGRGELMMILDMTAMPIRRDTDDFGVSHGT